MPNVYNNLGNLLSVKPEPQRLEWIGLGHSFDTVLYHLIQARGNPDDEGIRHVLPSRYGIRCRFFTPSVEFGIEIYYVSRTTLS